MRIASDNPREGRDFTREQFLVSGHSEKNRLNSEKEATFEPNIKRIYFKIILHCLSFRFLLSRYLIYCCKLFSAFIKTSLIVRILNIVYDNLIVRSMEVNPNKISLYVFNFKTRQTCTY